GGRGLLTHGNPACGISASTTFHGKTIPRCIQSAVKASKQDQDGALKIHRNSRISDLSQRCMIAGALALLIAAPAFGISSSFAQGVPIPKPPPKARGSIQMSASEQKGSTTTGATAATVPDPVIPDPHRNVPASVFASFDANQKAQAAKVSNYLS